MRRPFTLKVVTANALLRGDAVYLRSDGTWSPHHHEAELIDDPQRAEVRLHAADAAPGLVVGAYLADARQGPGGPEPVHFREAFRTRGPSNYPHGKQSEAS